MRPFHSKHTQKRQTQRKSDFLFVFGHKTEHTNSELNPLQNRLFAIIIVIHSHSINCDFLLHLGCIDMAFQTTSFCVRGAFMCSSLSKLLIVLVVRNRGLIKVFKYRIKPSVIELSGFYNPSLFQYEKCLEN